MSGTPVGTYLPVSGDITTALVIRKDDLSVISVYFATSMMNTNYIVKIYIQGTGSEITADSAIFCPVFRVQDANNFWISIAEEGGGQNLKVHLEVVSLDY